MSLRDHHWLREGLGAKRKPESFPLGMVGLKVDPGFGLRNSGAHIWVVYPAGVRPS